MRTMFERPFRCLRAALPPALLLLSACSKEPPRVHTEAVRAAPAAPSACPADAETLPSWPADARGGGANALSPEVLDAAVRGRCVREHLLLGHSEATTRHASAIETAAGPRLVVHQVHGMATLAPPNLILLAAESGLWANDVATTARLARLVPRRVTEVATSGDGTRFAYVTQDPPAGGQPLPRELVVVAWPSLEVLRRFPNVPEGRLRLSADGKRATLAARDEGLRLFGVEDGTVRAWVANDTVEDAFFVPGTQATVAYVGHDNAVAYRDLAANQDLRQSTGPQLPLVARRDLLSVVVDPASGRTFAGGRDNELHVYTGMLGREPRELAHVRLAGDVVDVACCTDGHIAAVTDTVNVAWLGSDYDIVRQIGPFLPDAASADARVALVGDRTVISMIGRVFVWTRDGFFVVPDLFAGEEVARHTDANGTVLALRSRGWLEFHRFGASGSDIDAESELLGTADWAVIDAKLVLADGTLVFVGREHGRLAAAFVPTTGPMTTVRGPLVGVTGTPVVVDRGDGVHFGVWDLRDRVLEIDATARTILPVGVIGGGAARSVTLAWNAEGDAWAATDETGAARALGPVPAATTVEIRAPLR